MLNFPVKGSIKGEFVNNTKQKSNNIYLLYKILKLDHVEMINTNSNVSMEDTKIDPKVFFEKYGDSFCEQIIIMVLNYMDYVQLKPILLNNNKNFLVNYLQNVI
jgi:hypothetical protein